MTPLIIVPGWRDSGPGHWLRAWGSEFVRLQKAGHINVESGFGAWPLGLALLQSLTGDKMAPAASLSSPSIAFQEFV